MRSSCLSSARVGWFPKGAVKFLAPSLFQMTLERRPRDLPWKAILQPNNSTVTIFLHVSDIQSLTQ